MVEGRHVALIGGNEWNNYAVIAMSRQRGQHYQHEHGAIKNILTMLLEEYE
jgi:hypothetical protein